MNKDQIHKLLLDVFSEFEVKLVDKSTWSKILIGRDLEVYTYSGYPDRDDNVWYFNTYYDGHSKETLIPKVNTVEFVQAYKDVFLDIIRSKEIIESVNQRLMLIGTVETIRDKKISNIIDYD